LRFFVCILSFLCSLGLVAQNQAQLDSLNNLVQNAPDSEEKVEWYRKIGIQYIYNEQDKSKIYLDSAYNLAKRLSDKKSIAYAAYSQSSLCILQQRHKEAIPYLLECIDNLKELENEDLKKAHAQLSLGRCFDELASYVNAINYFQESFNNYALVKDTLGQANALINKGVVYSRAGRPQEAIFYFRKVEKIYREKNSNVGLAYALNNIGDFYLTQDSLDIAADYFDQTIEITKKENMRYMLAVALSNAGKTAHSLGNQEKALEYFYAAQSLSDDPIKDPIIAFSSINIAQIKFEEDPEKNLEIANGVLETAIAYEDLDLQFKSLDFLSDMKSRMGDYKQALSYANESRAIRDSILNVDKIAQAIFAEQDALYNGLKKQEEINRIKQETLFNNKIKNAALIRNILIGGLLLLGTFVFLLIRARNNQRKLNREFEAKNEKLLKTEAVLEKKNQSLESYIESNIQLEQFAHIASHDLRTPLRTISSFIGLLHHKFKERATSDENENFNRIKVASKRLESLINDLLSFSKLNSQKLKVEECLLKDIIEELESSMHVKLKEEDVSIELLDASFVFKADQIKISRVLQNLIDNAIKFKQDDKKGLIKIQASETKNFYVITVQDNGIGINETYIDKVFEPFQQLHAKDEFEGTGLGLSISKNIIDKHGGTIRASNNEDSGASFQFTISKNA